jgi:hypothetical protein
MFHLRILIALLATLLLTACDIPGLGPDPRIQLRESEGRAVGGACRYAQRGIEECYAQNPQSPKTAVFEGWKDMDQYMRENKIEGQPPAEAPRKTAAGAEGVSSTMKPVSTPQAKATDKMAAKPAAAKADASH